MFMLVSVLRVVAPLLFFPLWFAVWFSPGLLMQLTLGPYVGWTQGLSPTLHNPFAWILSALFWLATGSGILLTAKRERPLVRRQKTRRTEATLESHLAPGN